MIIFSVWSWSTSSLHMSALSTSLWSCLQSDQCYAQKWVFFYAISILLHQMFCTKVSISYAISILLCIKVGVVALWVFCSGVIWYRLSAEILKLLWTNKAEHDWEILYEMYYWYCWYDWAQIGSRRSERDKLVSNTTKLSDI